MKCPHSLVIARPGGHDRFEKIEFGEVTHVVQGQTVPCGKCLVCRKNRAREWAVRLQHEAEYYQQMCFITLTYKDELIPILQDELTLWKNDLQKFFKRLRKNSNAKIKYFACGEYGGKTGRPHYHAIVFGWRPELSDTNKIGRKHGTDLYSSSILTELWPYGHNAVGGVSQRSIYYVTGYLLKKLNKQNRGTKAPEFMTASQGMGLQYAEQYSEIIRKADLKIHGVNVGTPLYYRKKIGLDPQILAEKKARNEMRTIKYYTEEKRYVREAVKMMAERARLQAETDQTVLLSRSAKNSEEI